MFFSLVWGCAKTETDLPAPRKAIAEVNGEPIYLDDFVQELNRIQIKTSNGLPVADAKRVQARVLLDNWINQALILQEAKNNHIVVGIDEVDAAYLRVRNGWQPAGFRATLLETSLSPAIVKAELRKLLLIKRYLRDVIYARIAIRDDEITQYVQQRPEIMSRPERVRVRQIIVKTKEEATNIAREIRRGMKFDEAAMKYSLGPEGKNGGDLGFFARGEMPAIYDEICFKLRTGELSSVVTTDYGFHLFKVIDREPITQRPMGEVRDSVENLLRHQRESSAQVQVIFRLRESAKLKLPTEKEIESVL